MWDAERINMIETREDLAKFVNNLANDRKNDAKSWENCSLESYLAAIAAWIEDMDGYYLNRNERPPIAPEWKTFAQILAAAKSYE